MNIPSELSAAAVPDNKDCSNDAYPDPADAGRDYAVIAQAIEFLGNNVDHQPNLDEIAAHVNLSKYHFQRLFKRWAGITPIQFLHYLTVEHAKERLSASHSILKTSLDVGLSGSSRLHDLFVNIEAMTPGEYKQQGTGLIIHYGFHDTRFGRCLIATTERGICALRFVHNDAAHNDAAHNDAVHKDNEDELYQELFSEWPKAQFVEDESKTVALAAQIFNQPSTRNSVDSSASVLDGKLNNNSSRVSASESTKPLTLLLKGTNFQVNVWKALMAIPAGSLVTYQDMADKVGNPRGVRAVASAVARNPIGYVIPCHRVISKAGNIHKYRWGETRKKAIIGWEGQSA